MTTAISATCRLLPVLVLAGLAAACDPSPQSGRGFTLPEGDAANGEWLFAELGCNSCHEIPDRADLREGLDPEMTVTLGGPTTQISTYGELVSSIIDPSHRIAPRYRNEAFTENGESLMRNYNDVITVSELADLVTFIQQQYELEPYTPTDYGH